MTIRSKQWYTNKSRPANRVWKSSMRGSPSRSLFPGRRASVKRRTIQRGRGKQIVDGANFRLIDEVHYIQERAAEQVGRVITLPQWLLFSTQTGDAWLLEPADHLAVPLARDGDTLPVYIEERTRTSPLVGQEPTASTAERSSTLNETQAGSAPSSATQHGMSSSRQDLKISNIFG